MTKRPTIRNAFTLIEILVVISILAILTALIIPQLRVVNKERGIREAARVVSSAFAQASQRGLIDGVSGVLLRRNPNFADATGYSFVVDSTSILRAVPDFHGDQLTDMATSAVGDAVSIPYPIEQGGLNIIKAGDEISFGNNSTRYSIATVTPVGSSPNFTSLTLGLARTGTTSSYLPDPSAVLTTPAGAPSPKPYTIHRLPRPLRSSETEIPRGFAVDLRFSGFSMLDSTGAISTVLEPNPMEGGIDFTTSDVAILFNEDGGVDRMVLLDNNASVFERNLVDNLRLFVTELSTDATENPINNPDNLWVSVNRTAGSTNVGYNVTPSNQIDLATMTGLYSSDRDEFNQRISQARGDSDTSVAAQ